MARFIARRLLQAAFTVWVVATVVFILIHLTGDPISVLAPETMSVHDRAQLAASLGLDQPILVQYGRFIWNVLHGDLGVSYYSGQPAMRLLLERVPVTAELVALSIAIATVFGLPFGIFAALWPESPLDRIIRAVSVLGSSIPTFFLGILLIFAFSVALNVLPDSGAGSMTTISCRPLP